MRKYYEVGLEYFKKGDDLQHALAVIAAKKKGVTGERWYEKVTYEEIMAADPAEAFVTHATALEESARTLRRMATLAKEHDLHIEAADTHTIQVSVDETIGDPLVTEGILEEDSYDDDEDDEDEDDEDEDEAE